MAQTADQKVFAFASANAKNAMSKGNLGDIEDDGLVHSQDNINETHKDATVKDDTKAIQEERKDEN